MRVKKLNCSRQLRCSRSLSNRSRTIASRWKFSRKPTPNSDREEEVISTSKRIAQAYLQMGQLSSAILEYETVLQRRPNDTDVQVALKQIEDKANNVAVQQIAGVEPTALTPSSDTARFRKKMRATAAEEIDDGRKAMHKVFVEGRIINAGDFDLCWRSPDLTRPPSDVVEPFIHTLSEKGRFAGGEVAQAACPTNRGWPICRWKNMKWTWNWRAVFRWPFAGAGACCLSTG